MNMYSRKAPYAVEVKADQTIYICQCGHSSTPPLCDGTHGQFNDVVPFPYQSHEDTVVHICGCGRSDEMPFCDGHHSKVED